MTKLSETIPVSVNQELIHHDNSIALQTVNLTKIYDTNAGKITALQDVNITIRKGEFVSIVGPSGSGKSTLLNMIGALDRPTRGSVSIDGINIFSLPDSAMANIRSKKIGFVFQSFNLIGRSNVQKNIELPAIISGIDFAERRKRVFKLLSILGIRDKAEQKPNNLSGGQQQRVAIARALINNPSIVLADEPTGNLDSKTSKEIFTLLNDLSKKYNRTIIMVTHNEAMAKRTDRSIYVRDGRVEKDIENR